MTRFEKEPGAAYWASYLVNGDASGIDETERALADAWLERMGAADVVDVGEPYFSWSYGFHTGAACSGGDLAEFTLRY